MDPLSANSPAGTMTDLGGVDIGVAAIHAAAGINEFGQVVGTTAPLAGPPTQVFLWSPSVKNGTSGTSTSFLSPDLAAHLDRM
jgi:hypothetical protein